MAPAGNAPASTALKDRNSPISLLPTEGALPRDPKLAGRCISKIFPSWRLAFLARETVAAQSQSEPAHEHFGASRETPI